MEQRLVISNSRTDYENLTFVCYDIKKCGGREEREQTPKRKALKSSVLGQHSWLLKYSSPIVKTFSSVAATLVLHNTIDLGILQG